MTNIGFTSTGKPWEIKYFETFETKSEAMKRELELKKLKNRTLIKELINKGTRSTTAKANNYKKRKILKAFNKLHR